MENPRLEEEKIIKNLRNLFRLKEEQNYTAIKDIRNLFRILKIIKTIKYKVLRSIKSIFEYKKEQESYCKPVKVNTFWNNDYIKDKRYGDKNRILWVVEYYTILKIIAYLRYLVNSLKQSNTLKIQLRITIIFISSKDDNDEDRVM